MQFILAEISSVVGDIINQARAKRAPDHATLITFSGDLGSGKTTLISEIARQLGIDEAVQSPTFVIYKIYQIEKDSDFKHFVHGDMYRLESADEIKKLGWDDILANPNTIICIEWPEKVTEAIPEWAIRVSLKHGENEGRILDIG